MRQRQLLGALLRSLVRRPLLVAGDLRLVEPRAGLRMEHVLGARVHEPANSGLAGRARDRLRSLRVHAVEEALVRQPLLGQSHRVEHDLAPRDSRRDGRRVGHVAAHGLDAGREHRRSLGRIADERAHLVAARGQRSRDGVPDLAGRAGDERLHRGVLAPGVRCLGVDVGGQRLALPVVDAPPAAHAGDREQHARMRAHQESPPQVVVEGAAGQHARRAGPGCGRGPARSTRRRHLRRACRPRAADESRAPRRGRTAAAAPTRRPASARAR